MRLPLRVTTPTKLCNNNNSSSNSSSSIHSTWACPTPRWLGLITYHMRMAVSRLCPLLMAPMACIVPHPRIFAVPQVRARIWNSGLIATHTTLLHMHTKSRG
ncbi:hypothetical protein M431DRAFT_80810 [Trichoderma harzianum CBS 226.95]|uniref:Uncharacterized protein n=1 Tax=Trichoderma harzianum CBS 226.95 TaxID=983964 RepID=A0A2T4AIV7_TRIHA|nr:hypothetical protein M431DRAFT_80810 [Trichoderma harzianum CBS 226.95]PTB57020.1 hypothetical protein M431DRAFT_80810 [Trichoderma harzianum CBS 226.95]